MNDSIIAYKNQQSKPKCFFSYIRLWRVVLLRSGIMLCIVILPAAAVCEYNTTVPTAKYLFCVGKNITPRETRHITRLFSPHLKFFLKVIK